MIRIATVIGARPQFIKASVMSRCFAKSGIVKEVIIHTGQHFHQNMSDVFFSQLAIPNPAYNLGINNVTHGKMTGQMLAGLEEIVMRENPDYLMVYGDTNSTLAGALAAAKLHIPVIHIEAGLRSRNNRMPEEINRILTDRISNLLCCPTEGALKNLTQEGFDFFDCTFKKTGDVMEDAVRHAEKMLPNQLPLQGDLRVEPQQYVLCTLHRAENTDDPKKLASIMKALLEIAADTKIVFPIHPRTRLRLTNLPSHPNMIFIEPVGYLENLKLMKDSQFVLTDSGGMQKEAYMLKKFCITLREETEWTELLDIDCNFVVGSNKQKILEACTKVRQRSWHESRDLYGGGKAGPRIYEMIVEDAEARAII